MVDVQSRHQDVFIVIRFGSLDEVHSLLKHQPELIHRTDYRTGFTPLHWAVYVGRHEIARSLIGAGADMHAQDSIGRWPVHLSYGTGDPSLIRLLEYHTFPENRDPNIDPFETPGD